MIALDTNILVRLIIDDDPAQTRAASALLRHGGLVVIGSVLMETEWVLRIVFRLTRAQIADALVRICGLEHIQVEQPEDMNKVLELFADGMDFADAMHVVAAASAGARSFATFDAKLRRRMSRHPDLPQAVLPG